MKEVIVPNVMNYQMELQGVRLYLRRALNKAPEVLRPCMLWDGRTLKTDIRTLWALTQDEKVSRHKSVRRLAHDLQRRFPSLFGPTSWQPKSFCGLT